jgi:hypothetical protein
MAFFDWILLGFAIGLTAEWLVPRGLTRVGELVALAAVLLIAETLTSGQASALGLLAGAAAGTGFQLGLRVLLRAGHPATPGDQRPRRARR